MKIKLFLLLVTLSLSLSLQARDDRIKLPIKTVMDRALSEGMIDGSVTFYWGDTEHNKAETSFGEITTSNKTNAFNKSDSEACEWAMLGAIKKFHRKAKQLGANAIVNIESNYKHQPFNSTEQFECGAGSFMAGVALKANFIKL